MTTEQTNFSAIMQTPPPGSAVHSCRLGDLQLESGEVIRDLKMSFLAAGSLNAEKSNTILSLHGLGANRYTQSNWAGPGKAFDTDLYFVIQPDTLGVASTDPEATTSPTRSGMNMHFPRFTLRDMVRAERALLAHLGIEHLAAVTGTSLGGAEALQWAVSFPDFMEAVIPMVTVARTNRQACFVLEAARQAIMLDPKWKGGEYSKEEPPRDGTAVALLFQNAFTMSSPWFERRYLASNEIAEGFAQECAAIGASLQARDWVYRTWAAETHDIGNTPGFGGDLAAAARSIKARVLLFPNRLDQLLSAAEGGIYEVTEHAPHAKLVDLNDTLGHFATTTPTATTEAAMTAEIRDLLQRVAEGKPGLSGPRIGQLGEDRSYH